MWRILSTDKSDIPAVARLLIGTHGEHAEAVAADKFAECKKNNDAAGMAFCTKVMLVIRDVTVVETGGIEYMN